MAIGNSKWNGVAGGGHGESCLCRCACTFLSLSILCSNGKGDCLANQAFSKVGAGGLNRCNKGTTRKGQVSRPFDFAQGKFCVDSLVLKRTGAGRFRAFVAAVSTARRSRLK